MTREEMIKKITKEIDRRLHILHSMKNPSKKLQLTKNDISLSNKGAIQKHYVSFADGDTLLVEVFKRDTLRYSFLVKIRNKNEYEKFLKELFIFHSDEWVEENYNHYFPKQEI